MIQNKKIVAVLLLLPALWMMGACKKTAVRSPVYGNLTNSTLQTIQQDSGLIILNAALIRSHLDSVFVGGGPYTVFAPTDSAFIAAGWPLSRIQAMDPDSLRSMIGYSIVQGKISGADLVGFLSQKFTSLNPTYSPQITKNFYGIFFNGFYVMQQIPTPDGVINKIGGVSLPPTGNLYQTILNNPNLTMCAYIVSKNPVLQVLALPPYYTTYDTLTLDGILQYPPDVLYQTSTSNGTATFKNFTLLLPSDSAWLASGYTLNTLDSISNISNPNTIVSAFLNRLSYWMVENEYFTSDFLYTGFVVQGNLGTGGVNGAYAPMTNTQFFIALPGDMGIRPDARTVYSFNLIPTVGDTYSQAPFIVGHITQPNIVATNGVIHIVDSVFHF